MAPLQARVAGQIEPQVCLTPWWMSFAILLDGIFPLCRRRPHAVCTSSPSGQFAAALNESSAGFAICGISTTSGRGLKSQKTSAVACLEMRYSVPEATMQIARLCTSVELSLANCLCPQPDGASNKGLQFFAGSRPQLKNAATHAQLHRACFNVLARRPIPQSKAHTESCEDCRVSHAQCPQVQSPTQRRRSAYTCWASFTGMLTPPGAKGAGETHFGLVVF